ncbi:MAG: hypothetical protein AAGC55_20290 [Myxococcota bacterium]
MKFYLELISKTGPNRGREVRRWQGASEEPAERVEIREQAPERATQTVVVDRWTGDGRFLRWALTAACILATIAPLSGCGEFSAEFACQEDIDCVRNGVQGQCINPQGFCGFLDEQCDNGLRWDSTAEDQLADTCVVIDDSAARSCAENSTLSIPITQDGQVAASATYSNEFLPELAVDGDFGTSWFSSGPELGGAPTQYDWSITRDECIEQVTVSGNERHAIDAFRTNFGFGQITVQVIDNNGMVVFSRTEQLPGTPDPTITMDIGGVLGNRVSLLLLGHESGDCGGFSELAITALR